MWPRNDGTFVTPQGQQVNQQLLKQLNAVPSSSDAARAKNGGSLLSDEYREKVSHFIDWFSDNSNVHPRNGDFDPDDEIDYSDSEFDEECSEFDEDDSELENELMMANQMLQQQAA